MTALYIIRHAEAEGNLYRRCHGVYDSPLTENGRRQLEALKERMTGEKIDVIYSSDLSRAYETAKAAAFSGGLTVIPDSRLREMNFGEWEDLPWGEIEWQDSERLRRFFDRSEQYRAPGGETYLEVAERVFGAVTDILRENEGRRVCIVSHALALRQLMLRLAKISGELAEEGGLLDNASVSLFEGGTGVYYRVYENDNRHGSRWPIPLPRIPKGYERTRGGCWFREAHFPGDAAFIENAWRESLHHLYSDSREFDLSGLLTDTEQICRMSEGAVRIAMLDGTEAGAMVLDPRNIQAQAGGHISFFYLKPEFRGFRFAIQLLGEAVSFYRRLGRKCLTLRVSTKNETAEGFYTQNGFKIIGVEPEEGANLLLMRKSL